MWFVIVAVPHAAIGGSTNTQSDSSRKECLRVNTVQQNFCVNTVQQKFVALQPVQILYNKYLVPYIFIGFLDQWPQETNARQ